MILNKKRYYCVQPISISEKRKNVYVDADKIDYIEYDIVSRVFVIYPKDKTKPHLRCTISSEELLRLEKNYNNLIINTNIS